MHGKHDSLQYRNVSIKIHLPVLFLPYRETRAVPRLSHAYEYAAAPFMSGIVHMLLYMYHENVGHICMNVVNMIYTFQCTYVYHMYSICM